jgi:hypothetical protein
VRSLTGEEVEAGFLTGLRTIVGLRGV